MTTTELPVRHELRENQFGLAHGAKLADDHNGFEHQLYDVVGNQLDGGHCRIEPQTDPVPVTNFASDQVHTAPHKACVAGEPNLVGHYADIVDDLEKVRIANENRLRAFVQDHGFGVDNPGVANLAELVVSLKAAEDRAIKMLEKSMKAHPLGAWVARTKGLGLKQAGRMLAAIGDPYWHDLYDRPRTKAELRSLCGWGDARQQRRQRGVKANWNADAKKRVWCIAERMVKGGHYRPVYDATREHYADAVHTEPCPRCGPAGKPALPGSPLSKGHQHARALRAVSKAILNDLYDEAKKVSPAHTGTAHHSPRGRGSNDKEAA